MTQQPCTVTDNTAASRFEWVERGSTAFADYRLSGSVLIIPHVEAPPALRGTGAAGRLMRGILQIARERGLKVRPLCSYAAAFMDKDPDSADIRA
jgi:uncharacterized protein